MKTRNTLLCSILFFSYNSYAQQGGGTESIVADTSAIESQKFSFNTESSVTNLYLWRGIVFNQGIISQSSFTVQKNGWNLNAWNSTSILETEGNSTSPELDFTLSKIIEPGNFYIEPSLMLYTYPSELNACTSEAGMYVGYYYGSLGIFFNPISDILQNPGGIFSETGITFDNETSERHFVINAALGTGNKKFVRYNISGEENFISVYKTIDLNASWQQNMKHGFYIKSFANFFFLLSRNYSSIVNPRPASIILSAGKVF